MKNKLMINNLLAIVLSNLFLCSICASIGLSATPLNLAEAQEAYYSDDLYFGGIIYETKVEEIIYDKKVTAYEEYVNPSFPLYYNCNNVLENVCACVAGANIIGYYDRFCSSLIPNFEPGRMRNSIYTYEPMIRNESIKQNLIDTLYVKMGSNSNAEGTSREQFRNGMQLYVTGNGYNISYDSVMSDKAIDHNLVYERLQEGKPIILYLNGYNISFLNESQNKTLLNKQEYIGRHIMIVYGVKKEVYYDKTMNIINTKIYYNVSSGWGSMPGIYVYDNNGIIENAEAVIIV